MAFTTADAKEAMEGCSDKEAAAWVKVANKAAADGKTEAEAKKAASAVAKTMKESGYFDDEPATPPAPVPAMAQLNSLFTEVGKVLSAANEGKVRTAVEALQAVLEALQKDTGVKESADPMIRKLLETESSSDVADGAYVLASIARLMGDEADEPDQLAMLTAAFNSVQKWISAEQAEIGTEEDADPAGNPYTSTTYSYSGWESAERIPPGVDAIALQEGAQLAFADATPIALSEGVLRRDGTVPVKIIGPGWGSSGYYSEALLKKAASKYKAGTKNFFDHPTKTEEADRPERSLRDLVGVLQTDGVYQENGSKGPGIYSDAKVYDSWQGTVEEMAGDIGLSHRALGTGHTGTAEGRTGRIIDDILAVESVDYVTVAGRDGQVIQRFNEAKRGHQPTPTPQEVPPVTEVMTEADRQRMARLESKALLSDATRLIESELGDAPLPAPARRRLAESFLAENGRRLPVKDGELDSEKLREQITEAVRSEAAYLTEAGGLGRVRGFGPSSSTEGGEPDAEATRKRLQEGFQSIGMSEAEAKIAAAGRA